ncbi:DEAD/DEAH box helicase [Salisediminibacterium beveridgei]|uniref:DEAD/DEAH box helicase n=1 Tax=Salisediminibacterium beveridgei TaxID=632773 RepID=UPI0008481A47|nr:SNF2-related protein [Salisediminibacterium beveridgei]
MEKTKQVISYFDHVQEEEPDSSFLILCPSTLLHHWEQELSEAFPEHTILLHQGPVSKRRSAFFKAEKTGFTIVSYSTAVRDEDLFLHHVWSAIVYDEAQKIKNIHTRQRKTAGRLTSRHAIALSGTPVENHPDEIWSLLNLLNPGYLGDRNEFGQSLQNLGIDALKEQIRPVILRRTKEEVQDDLQLPQRNIHHHTISLSFEQQSLYKACVEELMDTLEDGTESEQRVRIFKTMMKLKQICNHPAQLKKESGYSRFQSGRSQKWDYAQSLLRTWESEHRKAIIFTQFRYIGQLFQDYHLVHGGKNQIPFLHGGLTAANRKKMIHSFKTDPEIPYIVISLRPAALV